MRHYKSVCGFMPLYVLTPIIEDIDTRVYRTYIKAFKLNFIIKMAHQVVINKNCRICGGSHLARSIIVNVKSIHVAIPIDQDKSSKRKLQSDIIS